MGGGNQTVPPNSPVPRTRGNGRTGSPDDDPCDFSFETVLNAVDHTAIQKLNRGTRLKVDFFSENDLPRLQATLDGIRIGVIAHPRALEVIKCIQAGNQYVAIIVEKQGYCRVRLEREVL
jgi:hypothetical protein